MDQLQTERLTLRRFRASDLGNVARLETDADVMRFTPMRVPLSLDKIEARLQALIEKEAARRPLGIWAAELTVTKEFVGWLMLIPTEFAVPELGFMVVREQWGKGFATESARALMDLGTKVLHYPGIAAVTDADNVASIRILEKLGFEKVGSRTKLDPVLGRDVDAFLFEYRVPLSR